MRVRAFVWVTVSLSLLSLTGGPAVAQGPDLDLEVSGAIGLGGYWGDESFRGNGPNLAVGATVFPVRRLGFGVRVDGGAHSRTFDSGVRFEGWTVHAGGRVVLGLLAGAGARLQATGGAGVLHSDERSEFPDGRFAPTRVSDTASTALAWTVGLAGAVPVGRRLALRPELELVLADADAGVHRYYRASLGLGYRW